MPGPRPIVEKHMRDRRGAEWRRYASYAARGEAVGPLDVQALPGTLPDTWSDPSRPPKAPPPVVRRPSPSCTSRFRKAP